MAGRPYLLIAVALIALLATTVHGQTTPAVQMPGDNGKLGVQYQLGKKGDELVFTLEKAEFASRGFAVGKTILAEPGKRLLKLTFAVQNPRKTDAFFFEQSFAFTAVSPEDTNHAFSGFYYHPEKSTTMNMQLKPVQKVRCVAYVEIHPNGVVNKLIVQRGKGTPVLRYDLRDKTKALTGAFASDGGIDILEAGRAKLATLFELGPFDINVEKVEDAPAVEGFTLDTGKKIVIASVSVTNASMQNSILHSSILTPKMLDENGEELQYKSMSKMSSADSFNQMLEPGQQVRLRLVFMAAPASKPKTLSIKEYNSSRTVVVTLEPQK